MATLAVSQHPIAGKFDDDPRVFVDQQSGKYHYEDDNDQEWEWNGQAWIPLVDDALWQAQQSAYSVAGVDENTPSNAALAREERRAEKARKKAGAGTGAAAASSSSSTTTTARPPKQAPHNAGPKNTAVFVSSLPPTTTMAQLASVFSKAGVLLIGADGEPRIKLYTDDDGRFKGEALVMYFKEGSVDLAVRLLDDTELEMGAGMGNMRVREANYERYSASASADTGETKGQGGGEGIKGRNGKGEAGKGRNGESGTAAGEGGTSAEGEGGKKRKEYSAEEKQQLTKRIRQMQSKVTWHSDDEDDDPAAPLGGAPRPGQNRFNRVVVLKYMFKLADLEKEPALLLELKEDVRDEAESLGQVTNVVLYDKEEDGVMTVKFKDERAAQACVMKMNGRYFDGRRIYAGIYTGRERYRKSNNRGLEGVEEEKEEQERLEGFAAWLADGSDTED